MLRQRKLKHKTYVAFCRRKISKTASPFIEFCGIFAINKALVKQIIDKGIRFAAEELIGR